MTPALRDDIGVDLGKLTQSHHTLAHQNPHVLAAMAVSQPARRRSRPRKRSRSRSS
jgi:hypothetical protein